METIRGQMETIRVARTSSQADEWALVLTAAGIPHSIEPDGGGWALLVPPDDSRTAHAALVAYDEDTRREREIAATVPDVSPADVVPTDLSWTLGIALALILLGFFAVSGSSAQRSRWFEHGAAAAGLMASEPWRAVTALTLHVDAVHVASNAVATAVLVPAVAQRLGGGCGVLLVLVAGVVANLISAAVHDPRHSAVGVSTATFAAIGILAALRMFPVPGAPASTRKRWVVVTALVLLAMLGAGQNADVVAHALGLVSGAALGAAAGAAIRRPPRLLVQSVCGVLTAALVVGAWRLALGGI